MSTRLRSKIQNLLENLDIDTSDLGGGDDIDVNTSTSVVGWSAQQRPQDDTGGSGSDDDHSDPAADSGDAQRHASRSRQGRERRQNNAGFASPLEQLLSLERRVLQLMQEKQVSRAMKPVKASLRTYPMPSLESGGSQQSYSKTCAYLFFTRCKNLCNRLIICVLIIIPVTSPGVLLLVDQCPVKINLVLCTRN